MRLRAAKHPRQHNANRHRERVWFSPHCLKADAERMPLFAKELG